MIPRVAESTLRRLAEGYAVVAITGPRQSGKTTLARAVFAGHAYVSLENPEQREFAESDPRGFLDKYANGAVIDEAQRCPALFAWLQGVVDEQRQPGRFILTGSQQFGLLSGITQSLAGRVALLSLLPFTSGELQAVGRLPAALDEALFTGSYPPIFDRGLDPGVWYGNYVQTYLERDVRQLINVREAGVSHNTARDWISVLEASYIVHRLPPHHRNFNKRLVKTPKLYFLDAGLAAWLLSIETPGQLSTHPLRGALFETWVVAELLKKRLNTGRPSNLSFWRDRAGHEVDVLIETGGALLPVEIKSGATISRDAWRGLEKWREISGQQGPGYLMYGGGELQARGELRTVPWTELSRVAV